MKIEFSQKEYDAVKNTAWKFSQKFPDATVDWTSELYLYMCENYEELRGRLDKANNSLSYLYTILRIQANLILRKNEEERFPHLVTNPLNPKDLKIEIINKRHSDLSMNIIAVIRNFKNADALENYFTQATANVKSIALKHGINERTLYRQIQDVARKIHLLEQQQQPHTLVTKQYTY